MNPSSKKDFKASRKQSKTRRKKRKGLKQRRQRPKGQKAKRPPQHSSMALSVSMKLNENRESESEAVRLKHNDFNEKGRNEVEAKDKGQEVQRGLFCFRSKLKRESRNRKDFFPRLAESLKKNFRFERFEVFLVSKNITIDTVN